MCQGQGYRSIHPYTEHLPDQMTTDSDKKPLLIISSKRPTFAKTTRETTTINRWERWTLFEKNSCRNLPVMLEELLSRVSKVLPFSSSERWQHEANVYYRSIGSPDSKRKSIMSHPRFSARTVLAAIFSESGWKRGV